MDNKLTFYLMTSTHWDREWYEPFQGFRYRLVKVTEDAMDKLEETPEFGTFTFDGQTIVLEDFAEAAEPVLDDDDVIFPAEAADEEPAPAEEKRKGRTEKKNDKQEERQCSLL